MTRLFLETTPMLRDLMVAALAAREISREKVEFRCRGEQEKGRAPAGAFIQQGGMIALERAGIDVDALAMRGTTITRVAILDETAASVILEYSPALAGASPLPIFLPLADVREVLVSAAAPAPPINEALSQSNDSATGWTPVPCPGTLARVMAGRISQAGSVVLWTDRASTWCGAAARGTALPLRGRAPDHEHGRTKTPVCCRARPVTGAPN